MSLAFVNVFVALFVFGIVVAFLGATKLYLADKLSLNDARMARLFAFNQFFHLVGLLIAGYWLVSLSYKLVLVSGFLIIIFSIWLIGTQQTYLSVALSLSGLGVGGSFLNAGSNSLLPVLNPSNPASMTNLAHAFFGFGALVSPILIAYLLKFLGWKRALKTMAILFLIPTGAALIAFYPDSSISSDSTGGIALLWNKTIILALIASFFYVGIEVSFSTWITTYLKQAGWDTIKASSFLAFFWLALMIGRVLAGSLITLSNGKLIIELVVFILILTLIIMTTVVTPLISILSVLVLGLCCAPIFPTLIGTTFAKFDSSLSGNIYALIAAVGMGGATTLPYIIGRVSSSFSIYKGFKFLVVPASILLVITFYL